jgi:hypothetical protein
MNSTLSSRSLPKLWCDLNACGLSGEAGDNCYYGLHREQLAALQPREGMKVFVWDWSDDKSVIGCEAFLEKYSNLWRARPIDETWFQGFPDETFTF